jgi:hypothetical protein
MTFVWSCNVEESLVDNAPPKTGDGTISFVLPTGKKSGAQTYANIVGNDNEYKVVNLRIYWFTLDPGITPNSAGDIGANYKLNQRFAWGAGVTTGGLTPDNNPILFTHTAHQTTATISVGEESKKSRFYVIANVNDSLKYNCVESEDLLYNARAGVTTADEFEGMLTDELKADAAGNMKILSTPILMSLQKNTATPSGYFEVDDPAATGKSGSNIITGGFLKRRVARFDFINSHGYTNFKIQKVYISKAQSKTRLHDSVFSWDAGFPVGKMMIDDLDTVANGKDYTLLGDNNSNYVDDYFDANPADTADLNESVFYLYPTTLGERQTEIMIEGIYEKKEPRLYKLELPTDSLKVEANKVYRIKVVRSFDRNIKFNLTVMDWIGIDTIDVDQPLLSVTNWGKITMSLKGKPYGDTIDLNSAAVTDVVTSNTPSIEFSSSLTDSVKLSVTTEGANSNAAYDGEVTMLAIVKRDNSVAYNAALAGINGNYVKSDLDAMTNFDIVTTKTVRTYGTHYETTHTVALPPTDAPIEVYLKIVNNSNPLDKKVVKLRSNNYAKTGYKYVKVDNIKWAPLNVGAIRIPAMNDNFVLTETNQQLDCKIDSVWQINGFHFQYGRNVPFTPTSNSKADSVKSKKITTAFDTLPDALADKRWVGRDGDWLSKWDTTLWQLPQTQPCPPGWKMPTYTELNDHIVVKATANYPTKKNGWLRINADDYTAADPKYLYFPYAGYRTTGGDVINAWGISNGNAYYWAAPKVPALQANAKPDEVKLNGGGGSGSQANATWTSGFRCEGLPIRAVLNIDPW